MSDIHFKIFCSSQRVWPQNTLNKRKLPRAKNKVLCVGTDGSTIQICQTILDSKKNDLLSVLPKIEKNSIQS